MAREPQGVPSSLAVPLVLTLASIAPNCPQKYVEDGNIFLNHYYNHFEIKKHESEQTTNLNRICSDSNAANWHYSFSSATKSQD